MSDEEQPAEPEERRPRRYAHRWIGVLALILIAGSIGATLTVLAGDDAGSDDASQQAVSADPEDAAREAPRSGSVTEESAQDSPAEERPSVPDRAQAESPPAPIRDQPGPPSQAPAGADTEEQGQQVPQSEGERGSEAEAPPPIEEPEAEPDDDPPLPEEPESAPTAESLGLGPFAMPIAGACFPEFAGQLPGAPRAYRNGTHEGIDFYPGWACAAIELATAVLAIGEGRVIRADWDYEELTTDLYFEMKARGFTGPEDLDTFRGRQIWVDHGDGVVARYAHLSGIAEAIGEGVQVSAGDVLGFIGESGTPGALREAGSEIHLHFELRLDDGYLGQAVGPEAALQLYRVVFPSDP